MLTRHWLQTGGSMAASASPSLALDNERGSGTAVRQQDNAPSLPRPQAAPPAPTHVCPADEIDPSQDAADAIDRVVRYTTARYTAGLSPTALAEAYFDWALHLASA